MRRLPIFLLAALAALSGAACSGEPAQARTIAGLYAESAVYDGNYAYYTSIEPGYRRTKVMRQSLSGGRPKPIAYVRGWANSVVSISAAGGRVAVGVQTASLPRSTTRVVSFSSGGKLTKNLATGAFDERRKVPTASGTCGSVAELVGSTADGAVLVKTTRYLASRGKCQLKTRPIGWSVEAVYPDDRRVGVVASDQVARVPGATGDIVSVEVNGNYAAFVMKKTLRVFVRNLTDGSVAGSLVDSVRLGGMTPTSNRISLGPNGMLAVMTDRFRTKPRFSSLTRADVFGDPASTNATARSDAIDELHFCGDRLIELHYSDESGLIELRQLDPANLSTLAVFTTTRPYTRMAMCTGDRALLYESGDRGDIFHSVELKLG